MNATTRSVERYVAGRMDEAEARRFKALIRSQPEIAAEVDAHERIKASLERLEQHGQLEMLLGQRAARPNYLKYALAVLVLISLLAVATFRGSSRDAERPILAASVDELSGSAAGRAVSGTYPLANDRAQSAARVINITRRAGALRLQVMPEMPEATSFSVALARANGVNELPLAHTTISRDAHRKTVDVFIDTAALGSGEYRLTMTSQDVTPEITDVYPFGLKIN